MFIMELLWIGDYMSAGCRRTLETILPVEGPVCLCVGSGALCGLE